MSWQCAHCASALAKPTSPLHCTASHFNAAWLRLTTLSLFTTMFWSSNKQTHMNIQVKRNPYLLMVGRRAHRNLKTEWIIYKPGFEKSKITFSIIATITKAVESINYKSACRWACTMAKSNHQQQHTNNPCVVSWSCSDKTLKKPGETDLELHISSSMKTLETRIFLSLSWVLCHFLPLSGFSSLEEEHLEWHLQQRQVEHPAESCEFKELVYLAWYSIVSGELWNVLQSVTILAMW